MRAPLLFVPAVMLALGTTACTSSPVPPPPRLSPSPSAGQWAHLSLNRGDLSFEYPAQWRAHHYTQSSSFSDLLVYLSNQQLHAPCNGGGPSCGWPVARLAPRGVLISWSADGMPGWTIDKAQGSPRTVGGRPAKLVEQRPGLCKAIGGDKSISVVIAGRTTDNFYGLDACFRGPGEPTAVRWVQRMLTSTRIKGP